MEMTKNMSTKDVFLDNTTGDFYTFKKDIGMWMPVGNVGIHYAKAAEENGTEGGFIRKVKTYKPKPSKYSTQEVIQSKITERKCIIKKEHFHHWAVKSMDKQFAAINESMWDPHPIGLSSTPAYEVNYVTIADSERGAEVVEHRNTIAVQFHIDKKYLATVQLLHNFIDKKFETITENSRVDMTIEEAENYTKSLMYSQGPLAPKTTKNVAIKSRAMFVKKNAYGVETNSVRKDGIRPSTARS
jgi:hypothetical protein